jgi:HlyD family secretion protein
MNKLIITLAVALTLLASVSAQRQEQAPKGGAPTVVKAVGSVQPELIVEVSAEVRGTIQKLGPASESGAEVKKGDVLAEIDPRRYQAELTEAKASVQEAEANLKVARVEVSSAEREVERAKRLKGTGGISQAEFDVILEHGEVAKGHLAVAEAKLARTSAALTRCQLDLEACTIRAPIDGVILDRRASVGNTASDKVSAPPLFVIASDLKKVQVWAAVKEADIGRVAKGQAATFTVDALPKVIFKGRVSQIRLNATVDKRAVTYTVIIEVDDSDRRLLPYLTANVNIEVVEGR